MRIGIYAGRHAGGGGGIGLYAREFVRALLVLIEERQAEDAEFVFYGDSAVFDAELTEEVNLSSVLTAVVPVSLIWNSRASSYFRPLPNGAKVRVLVRLLPTFAGRMSAMVLDQPAVPLVAGFDRIELLHSLNNVGFPLARTPQLVTVHDLFQAWPPGDEQERSIRSAARSKLYRSLFRRQFSLVRHAVADSARTADELKARLQFNPAQTTVVPLGIDSELDRLLDPRFKDALKQEKSALLQRRGLPADFVLHLASADPRKNLARSIDAWRELPSPRPKLVLVAGGDVRGKVRALAQAELEKKEAVILDPLPRRELLLLLSASRALLVPSLAEGFGLPALEAASLSVPVVTPPLDHLPEQLVFACDPEVVDSISKALRAALNSRSAENVTSSNRPRTMLDAVRETIGIYRQVYLQTRGSVAK